MRHPLSAKRLSWASAKAGILARTRTYPLFLQLRDSAGLGPASPIAPLASGLWGTSAAAVFGCGNSITLAGQVVKLHLAFQGD